MSMRNNWYSNKATICVFRHTEVSTVVLEAMDSSSCYNNTGWSVKDIFKDGENGFYIKSLSPKTSKKNIEMH